MRGLGVLVPIVVGQSRSVTPQHISHHGFSCTVCSNSCSTVPFLFHSIPVPFHPEPMPFHFDTTPVHVLHRFTLFTCYTCGLFRLLSKLIGMPSGLTLEWNWNGTGMEWTVDSE